MRTYENEQESDWEGEEEISRKPDWKRNRRQARRVREDERLKFDSEDTD